MGLCAHNDRRGHTQKDKGGDLSAILSFFVAPIIFVILSVAKDLAFLMPIGTLGPTPGAKALPGELPAAGPAA